MDMSLIINSEKWELGASFLVKGLGACGFHDDLCVWNGSMCERRHGRMEMCISGTYRVDA